MGRIKLTEEQIRIAERVKNGQGASTQQAPSAYRGGRITLNQKQIQIASKYGLVNQDYAKNRQETQTTVDDPLHKQYAAFMAYQNAVREAELAQIKMKPYLSGTKKTKNDEITGKVSQQEYGRSPAMQAEYGTYENYLRGVTAEQGRKLGTQALRQQSALLAGQFAPATQKTREDVNALNRRTRAAENAQRDQVRGMRRTSQELGKQIEALEEEQADAHFAANGRSASGKGTTQLQDEINALQDRKNLVDSQSVLDRAQDAMRGLSEEDQNLLRQYRGQELNGYQVRAYAKYDAKKALNEKGYSDNTLKRLAEWQKVLDDYENAQSLDQAAQEMGSGSFAGKAAATLFSAALAPGKALGNVESLRGVLPSWAGGYQNEDMPTNIYSPAYNASRLSSGIRQSVMQNMNPTGQFLYQAGTSALDSAVNMAVSTGLVGTIGGAAGAGAQDAIAETMNWVMGSQVAADSVFEGIQNGKSNADALVDGIVEGAIEGFTEKYSVGDIIENMLSGKAVWKKMLRSFASEGGEEVVSNWMNTVYDVISKQDRSKVHTAYAKYIAEGMTPARAFAQVWLDNRGEDALSFLAGGLSGLAMSGTYAGVNRVILEANVTQTARAVIEAGEVQDVIDYGMAQEEGTKAHQLAEELQQTVDDGGEVTQKAVEDTLREVAKEQQAAVDEGQEPRVPETLTRLEQLQAQEQQRQAQAEADEKTFQIYKDAKETAQENQRLSQQFEQEQAQNRAQQSVQAVQQAQRAAQQQYDQDSLLATIPGTENMGELDMEQYARQQTADAEQALDEAAAQQEEQYLQTQAQRAGYDEQTAAYFLNGNTTGMPAEQYAQSFGQVYEQGRLGASEQRAMRYAEGMNQDVAAAAYRAGLAAGQKGVNNGSIEVTDEGQIGQAGQRAEGQVGGVRQSTEQRQKLEAGRKRAQGARDLAKAWDEVELSTLGFGKDNTRKVRVMPKEQEARSEDIQAAAKFFRSMGVQNARFFTGQLTQEIDGQTFYADAAVTEDGAVLIRADSEEYSAFELAKHEGYHLLVKRWPEMAAKIQKRLLGEGKITKEMIESYVDAYAGIYGDDTDAYVEEIVADTYAGMNRTDYGTNKLRADVKVEVGQWQKKSGSARAPPVKMSASKAEKYDFTKPFAEQVDDWKAGKIGKNDTLVVGPTPEVFQKVGFNALPVTINQTHVDYALNGTKDEEHHIGEPMLKQLPRAMKSPVAIIASESQRGTSVVALLPFIKDAKTVIIPVYIDGFGRQNSVVIDSNAVTSIYEKKNAVTGLLTNAIKKSNNGETTLFYVDKVKAAALYQVARVPMPKMPGTDNGFVASIRDEGSTVKPKLKNVTQSQQFKRWFGDWQNHPESASKVVNADGTPKVVYHGTNAEFNTFQQENGAYFFSESRDYAESMADERRGNRIIEAYLKMKNPYTVKLSPEQFTDNIAEAPFIRYAKEHGHDGVIFEYDGSKEDLAYDKFYVVFDSTQIKSATDNIGTFDKTNPDIRYSASVQPTKEDQRYLEAVERGDVETVQRMVDDAATMAGYTVDAYHGTQQFGFTEFLREKSDNGGAFYFGGSTKIAGTYAGEEGAIFGETEYAEGGYEQKIRAASDEQIVRLIENGVDAYREEFNVKRIIKPGDAGERELREELNKNAEFLVYDAQKGLEWAKKWGSNAEEERAAERVKTTKAILKAGKERDFAGIRTILDAYREKNGRSLWEGADEAWEVNMLAGALQALKENDSVVEHTETDDYNWSERRLFSSMRSLRESAIKNANKTRTWRGAGRKGMYHVKLDLGENLEIDAGGSQFSNVPVPTGFFAEDLQKTTASTREIETEAEARGYDSVTIKNIFDQGGLSSDQEKPDTVYIVFDSNRIKSADPVAYDDAGNVIPLSERFDQKKTDIRYSSQDGRYRDLMEEKPAQYVRGLERRLVNELAENLSVPGQAKREVLQPMAEEALRTFFTDGQLDRAKLNDLFETAYKAGVEEDQQYIEQYGDLKKFIRDQKLSISEKDRQDIADFNLFRKAAMGTLTISKDGLSVDVAYQQLQEMAPELFPADITAPSDQLMQIYDVARGIQKVQKTLDEYYGPQAASFKKWQQANFTESIDRVTSGLRVAQRYLEAQNKAKEKLAIPQTAEETKKMWAQLKDARRVVEKAQSKTLLTEADQKIVNRLLRGETDPNYVAGLENGQQILKVYEAKADYDMLAMKLKAWNAQRKQGLRDFAEQALNAAEAEKWVDKAMGIRYQRETMERNIRDIARKGKVSDEKANEFINKYFWPVHENESKRKNYLVEKQNQIRALKLDRQVRKGNLVSESYAVQWLGEAEFNRDYLKQHPRAEKRGGKTFDEWNAAIQDFEKANPNMDLGKVRGAVKVFHEVYDKLFQDMNRVRIENGYEPVNYLQGYFPHFQENEEGGNILQKFARAAGIEGDVSPLPATINGLTANFKPGIRYMANIQNRLGYATAYDALQGFDRYIEVATDVIFHTADIQRLRALATQIRYRASDEGLKQRIDAIMMNPFLNPDEANEQVTNLTKEGRYGLSNFVDELDEYTNLLAGKKSRLDRGMEKTFGRQFYNVMKKFESRVGANMVAANVGSALTNFIPIAQAAAQTGGWNMVIGMRATLKNYWNADGLSAASVFINNRSGYGRLAESTMDKVSEKAGILMEIVDRFTTGSVVRARYYQNLQRGMSEMSAMQEADQFASGVMADRSKGSTPTLYSARNPFVKLFTQFQLEVNNTLSWVFKDLYQEERKKGILALCKAMFGWMLGSWVLNEAYEAMTGRRMGQDPFDIINDTVGDITGYQIPNTIDAMISGEWDFTTQKEDTYGVAANLTQNLLGELPFTQVLTMLGLEVDNGRIAVASAIPDLGAVLKAATSKDIAPEKRGYTIRRELAKPAYYLVPPFGGGQARKLIQGGVAAWKGGSYTVDNEGRDILQYPVYNDNAEDRAKSWAQALLFGKTATEEAQSWVESGFKSLSAKETAAYQGMVEGGEEQRETYAFIQAARKLEKDYDKKMLLKAYDISDAAKAEYYYQVLAGDTQKAEMEPMNAQERIDYMNEKIQDAEGAKQKQDLKDSIAAGTVTQEKAIQKILANDYAEDENKAYWLYKEWTGGKDYTKYGKILQTIEDGGDLKAAAKEYFDHGAEKGDIGSEITKAYKPQYIAASPEERKKLKEKLLAAYVTLGFNRADKSKDIDRWLDGSK